MRKWLIIGRSGYTAAHNLYKKEAMAGNLWLDGRNRHPDTPQWSVDVDVYPRPNFSEVF